MSGAMVEPHMPGLSVGSWDITPFADYFSKHIIA